jgi:O-antigen ligase
LSAIFSGINPGNEWRGFRSILFWVSFGWVLSRSNYSKKEFIWIIWIAILSTIPPLIWGLIEKLVIHTKDSLQLHSVGHVNHSAIYLGIILGSSLSVSLALFHKFNLAKKILLIILPILFFVGVIISQSRGVFGISIIRLTLIILLIPNTKKTKLFAFIIFIIILTLMPFLKASIIQKQILNQNSNSVLSDRNRVWNVSIEAMQIHPIFGMGNGNWNKITLDDIKKERESKGLNFNPENYNIEYRHAHSVYFCALVERGIIGFLVLISLMVMWALELLKSYRNLKNSSAGILIWGSSFSAWFVTFGVGFVNTTFHHEHAILSLLFLGLHLSASKNYLLFINKKNKKSDECHKKTNKTK